ncbi:hypothetical protein [Thaumasiovibrio sp. DFM-14]|uniref:hypothetical protein n=1 Tax=Thaumasiovibrio sp. DFM-14 TaxID=3384792 RepID=UPI0039A17423
MLEMNKVADLARGQLFRVSVKDKLAVVLVEKKANNELFFEAGQGLFFEVVSATLKGSVVEFELRCASSVERNH